MAEAASGVLQGLAQRGGFLRDAEFSFQPSRDDVHIPARMIKELGLVNGAVVSGDIKETKKGRQMSDVVSINGLPPRGFCPSYAI